MKPWKPLPSYIDYLDYQVRELARPAALLKCVDAPAKPGSTHLGWQPDKPLDATWPGAVEDSLHDGEAFVFQLNLAEIPASVRRPGWPEVGVVWVFADLSDLWKVRVEFDPRPAEAIPWSPTRQIVRSVRWDLFLCPPYATEHTLPEVYYVPEYDSMYSDWLHDQMPHGERIIVGGWIQTIQGFDDTEDQYLVAGLGHLHFGDCGCIYLLYDPKTQRWWGRAETA